MANHLSQFDKKTISTLRESDLFIGFRYGDVKDKELRRKYKLYENLAGTIFADCLYEIVLDVIENNITFVLPLMGGSYGEICGMTSTEEEFIERYKTGFLSGVDYIKSGFTYNRIVFNFRTPKGKTRRSTICLYGDLKKRLLRKTNNGEKF